MMTDSHKCRTNHMLLLLVMTIIVFANVVVVATTSSTAATDSPHDDNNLISLHLRHVLVYQGSGALLTSITNHSWNEVGEYDILVALPLTSLDEDFKVHLKPSHHQQTDSNDAQATASPPVPSARVVRSKIETIVNADRQREQENITKRLAELSVLLEDVSDDRQALDLATQTLKSVFNVIVPQTGTTAAAGKHEYSVKEMQDVALQLTSHNVGAIKRRRELERVADKYRKEQDELHNKASQLYSGWYIRLLRITVAVETPGAFDLEVSWLSQRASWSPSYGLNLDTTSQQQQPGGVGAAPSPSGKRGGESTTSPATSLLLHYDALITQQTGIDWINVSIQLSTGTVRRNESVPVLQPWMISLSSQQPQHINPTTRRSASSSAPYSNVHTQRHGRHHEPQATSSSVTSESGHAPRGNVHKQALFKFGGGGMMMEDEAATGGGGEDGQSATSSTLDLDGVDSIVQGVSDVFTLKGTHTVRQDGVAHHTYVGGGSGGTSSSAARVPIGLLRFRTNITVLLFPRQVSAAFLRGEFINDSPLSLLPGRGQAFLDGSLLGSVSVAYTGVGSKCVLNLGTDKSIEVQRHVSNANTADSSSGIFRTTKQRSKSRDVITVVTSKRTHPVDVIVRELIPQPTHNSIKVTLRQPWMEKSVSEVLQDEKNFPEDGLTMPLKLTTTGAGAPGPHATNSNNHSTSTVTLVRYPGMVEWVQRVSAQSKHTIFYSYDVTWVPEDHSGLDDVMLDL